MLHKKKMMAIAYRVHSVPCCSPSLCFKFKLEKFLFARDETPGQRERKEVGKRNQRQYLLVRGDERG